MLNAQVVKKNMRNMHLLPLGATKSTDVATETALVHFYIVSLPLMQELDENPEVNTS